MVVRPHRPVQATAKSCTLEEAISHCQDNSGPRAEGVQAPDYSLRWPKVQRCPLSTAEPCPLQYGRAIPSEQGPAMPSE